MYIIYNKKIKKKLLQTYVTISNWIGTTCTLYVQNLTIKNELYAACILLHLPQVSPWGVVYAISFSGIVNGNLI